MRNFSDFISMGGYGFYIWGSYLFALIAIAAELVGLSRRKKALQEEQKPVNLLRGRVTNETTT
jgi:heme exporter protein D